MVWVSWWFGLGALGCVTLGYDMPPAVLGIWSKLGIRIRVFTYTVYFGFLGSKQNILSL